MRLRRNEYCPIHKSISCCGRELIPKTRTLRLGVQRIEDPHRPRGYRELRSPAEMRKRLRHSKRLTGFRRVRGQFLRSKRSCRRNSKH